MTSRKIKKLDTLDNLYEIIKIAQQVYELKWDQKISVEKVKFLYEFLFDQIVESMSKGMRVNIYNFGTFNRHYWKPRTINALRNEKCFVPEHYEIRFKACPKVKQRVNREFTAAADEPVEKKFY